jgi:hypothetical protein
VRLEKLPGWVVGDDASVRDEIADYVGATPERLWDLTRKCARSAVWALGFHPDRKATLDREDPLPASTLAALARLRAERRG